MTSNYLIANDGSYAMSNFLIWTANFLVSLCGTCCSLYLLVSHDDMDCGAMQPLELSDAINQYLPIEYICSAAFVILSFFAGPWILVLLGVPLAVFNLQRLRLREYKTYFISRKEYSKQFKMMET